MYTIRDENNSRLSAKIRSCSCVGRPIHFTIGQYGRTRDTHARDINYPYVFRNAESSKWLPASERRRQWWNRARAEPQKQSSRKGKCRRKLTKSGNGAMRRSISRWRGYMLTWTIRTSLLYRRFGALFVGGMRLEYAGSKVSRRHGSRVQATIKRVTLPTTPTASPTRRP